MPLHPTEYEMQAADEQGTLSPAGRFARMEAALIRIEDKLDTKADENDLHVLVNRLVVLESERAMRDAVTIANDKANDARYRIVWTVVGFLTIINIALGAALAIGALLTNVV